MEFYFNFALTTTSIAMIGALLSFAGVGLLILVLSERMFHGLSKLFYFLASKSLQLEDYFPINILKKIKLQIINFI